MLYGKKFPCRWGTDRERLTVIDGETITWTVNFYPKAFDIYCIKPFDKTLNKIYCYWLPAQNFELLWSSVSKFRFRQSPTCLPPTVGRLWEKIDIKRPIISIMYIKDQWYRALLIAWSKLLNCCEAFLWAITVNHPQLHKSEKINTAVPNIGNIDRYWLPCWYVVRALTDV